MCAFHPLSNPARTQTCPASFQMVLSPYTQLIPHFLLTRSWDLSRSSYSVSILAVLLSSYTPERLVSLPRVTNSSVNSYKSRDVGEKWLGKCLKMGDLIWFLEHHLWLLHTFLSLVPTSISFTAEASHLDSLGSNLLASQIVQECPVPQAMMQP